MRADIAARMLDRVGQDITLRRAGQPDLTVKAFVTVFPRQRDQEAGGVKQFYQQVIVSNAEIAAAAWPAPPVRGDRVVVDGKLFTVQSVDAPAIGDTPTMYVLQTLGGS